MAKLQDVIRQIRGVSYQPEDIRVASDADAVGLLRANNIRDGALNFDEVIYIDKRKVKEEQYLRAGDTLICASSGSKELVGKAAYTGRDLPMTFGAFCKVARPRKGNPEYIGRYFESPYYRLRISDAAAGVNINNIRKEHIDALEIPFPSEIEQASIASVLGKVSVLIDLHKRQLVKLDELVKARFVEMFRAYSDDTVKAGSILYGMRNGVSPSTNGTYHEQILTLSAFTQGEFNADFWKSGYFENLPPSEKRIAATDFYICRGNGNKTLVGTGVYSKNDYPDLIFPDTVIAAHIDQQRVCLPYLYYAWKQPSIRNQIEANARTTNGTFKINQKVISNIDIILPLLELQKSFAAFVEQSDKLKLAIRRSLAKLRTLKAAFMQKYFG